MDKSIRGGTLSRLLIPLQAPLSQFEPPAQFKQNTYITSLSTGEVSTDGMKMEPQSWPLVKENIDTVHFF